MICKERVEEEKERKKKIRKKVSEREMKALLFSLGFPRGWGSLIS